jgi:hypothetical protein
MNELMASKPAAGAKPKMKRKAFEKELRKTKSPPYRGVASAARTSKLV